MIIGRLERTGSEGNQNKAKLGALLVFLPITDAEHCHSLQPYHPECTRSCLISEAKLDQAWLVLGCENNCGLQKLSMNFWTQCFTSQFGSLSRFKFVIGLCQDLGNPDNGAKATNNILF